MFRLQNAFVCAVWFTEQTATIVLHSINLLTFIAETVCVYFAVRTENLNTIQIHLNFLKAFTRYSPEHTQET